MAWFLAALAAVAADPGVLPPSCGVHTIPANLSATKATGGSGGVFLRVLDQSVIFAEADAIHGSHGLGFALQGGDLQVSVGVNFQNSLVKKWVPECAQPGSPGFQCVQSRTKRSSDQGASWRMLRISSHLAALFPSIFV